ncbi:MAG: hypothetical protein IKD58_12130 [Loktanella sp.]|nr:hypothetical protein [Loktanella sp.]
MQLITFFAPKGGSGRTTAMMATASGLLSAGHSVAVIDLTEQVRPGWIFGPSFIRQWEDRMLETGAKADQFVTVPASDYVIASRALSQFFRDGFEYVLVDTGTHQDLATIALMNQSDLVIVPMRGPHEAAWSSEWLAKSRFPKAGTYGLVTGASDHDTGRLARATFTATPVLHTALPRLDTFDSQVNTGMLHAQRRFVGEVFNTDQAACMHVSHDWIAAYSAADALCAEIQCLLKGQKYPPYTVNTPLAKGHTFAHLQALYRQPGYERPL